MIYKKSRGPRGRSLYFLDGKMISVKTIPPEIVASLEIHNEYNSEVKYEAEKPVKHCLFCGMPATKTRVVNGMIVELCDEDYYDKSIGKIAGKLTEEVNAEA